MESMMKTVYISVNIVMVGVVSNNYRFWGWSKLWI